MAEDMANTNPLFLLKEKDFCSMLSLTARGILIAIQQEIL